MLYNTTVRYFFLLCFCIATTGWLPAQNIVFKATTDVRQVMLNNTFDVTFTINNSQATNFTPPDFKNFQVLSGPNKSVSTSIINGSMTSQLSMSYSIRPQKIGKPKIGSASIKVGNKTYKTRPIAVNVVKGKPNTAATQPGAAATPEGEVFIRAEPTAFEAFTGQEVLLDYKLYTTIDVENFNIIKETEYSGCYAEDLRRYKTRVLKEVYEGKQYSTKVLKRVALFPQQGGKIEVSPMTMQIGVKDPNAPQSRGFFFRRNLKKFLLDTEPVSIKVKPLPAGAPLSFSGGVGEYEMNCRINKAVLTTDDALALTMTITGSGDIKRVQPPKLNLDDKFEVYDPRTLEEESFENQGGFTGRKVIEYLILPKEIGSFSIRPEFSFFNTDSIQYFTLQSRPLSFKVRQGNLKKNNTLTSIPNPVDQDIRPAKMSTSLSKGQPSFFGSGFFWGLSALPFFFLGFVVFNKQKQFRLDSVDPITKKRNRATKVAQKRLTQAKDFMDKQDSKSFYDEVSRAMFGYICDKLNMPYAELTKANVREKLVSLKVSENHIERFMGIGKTCEMALFAGKDNAAAMQETYDGAVGVIAGIEGDLV